MIYQEKITEKPYHCKHRICLLFLFLIPLITISSCNFDKASVFTRANLVLKEKLDEVIKQYPATVGVAVIGIEDKDTILINNDHHYPTQSTYKFPLALCVLHMVDNGLLSLDQKIHIGKEELRFNTWSPLRAKDSNGNFDLSVADLLQYTVSQSDNITTDVLFKLIGGVKNVDSYLQSLGINEIKCLATEKEMAQGWHVQYANWSTPMAMASLLMKFYSGKILSTSSNKLLMNLMILSANSSNRIKGLLPPKTIVAHKTGTGYKNEEEVISATNDIGIVTLPNGKHFIISVFVSDAKSTIERNEKLIATIAKVAYDYFMDIDSK